MLIMFNIKLGWVMKKQNTWENSLKPAGIAGKQLELVKESKTEYWIVVPEEASVIEKNAAAELAKWLEEITKAEFVIVGDDKAPVNQEICIGQTNRHHKSEELGYDGYAIKQDGDRLLFSGGTGRGLINGVMAFLEEDLGCRWYTDKAERIPDKPNLTLSIVSRSYTPQLQLRDPYYFVSFNGDWSLRNRTNAPDAPVSEEFGGHIAYPAVGNNREHVRKNLFVHTYHTLIDPEETFDEHPDYWMLDEEGKRIKHQLCETHPEVLNLVAESTKKFLRASPQAKLISISKMDGGGTCLCERCKKLNEEEGSDAASLLTLVNHVAAEIEDEFPDVLITTLAYLETIKLPKTIRPRPNVGMRVCNDICSWPFPFKPVEQCEELVKITQEWASVCKRMYIWDYNANFSHYCIPMPNMEVIADNIRFWIANNAEGIMTQGAYQSAGAERDWMRSWIIAKLLWDPTLDVYELMQDFIWGYFGKAAPAMAEYNKLLEGQYHKYGRELDNLGGIRYNAKACFLTDGFVEKADEIFTKAFELADNDEIKKRLELDYLPILYVEIEQWEGDATEGYLAMVDRFEATAKRENLTYTGETVDGPNIDHVLKVWRDAKEGGMVKITPDKQEFEDSLKIKISSHMGAVKLTYTLDGSEPTCGSTEVPKDEIEITESCELKVGMYMVGSCVGSTVAVKQFKKIA